MVRMGSDRMFNGVRFYPTGPFHPGVLSSSEEDHRGPLGRHDVRVELGLANFLSRSYNIHRGQTLSQIGKNCFSFSFFGGSFSNGAREAGGRISLFSEKGNRTWLLSALVSSHTMGRNPLGIGTSWSHRTSLLFFRSFHRTDLWLLENPQETGFVQNFFQRFLCVKPNPVNVFITLTDPSDDALYSRRWHEILKFDLEWVQIISWNDFGER